MDDNYTNYDFRPAAPGWRVVVGSRDDDTMCLHVRPLAGWLVQVSEDGARRIVPAVTTIFGELISADEFRESHYPDGVLTVIGPDEKADIFTMACNLEIRTFRAIENVQLPGRSSSLPFHAFDERVAL